MKKFYVMPMIISEPVYIENSFLAASYQSPYAQSKEFVIDEVDNADENSWGYREFIPWKDE
jgi:hypothetical protein